MICTISDGASPANGVLPFPREKEEKEKSVTSQYIPGSLTLWRAPLFSTTFFQRISKLKEFEEHSICLWRFTMTTSTLKSQKSCRKNSCLALTQSFPNSFVCSPLFHITYYLKEPVLYGNTLGRLECRSGAHWERPQSGDIPTGIPTCNEFSGTLQSMGPNVNFKMWPSLE